jgi:AcrR family transcriptional regulator
VEDITRAAGVSRVTFYRHFATKAAVALELFRRATDISGPRLIEIGARDFRDRATVLAWLAEIFTLNREMRGIVRVLSQANAVEAGFSEQVRPFIFDIITALGQTIPAFALAEGAPGNDKRRVRAWLLIYTILDQSNHAATARTMATHPMMIDVLADSFLHFVTSTNPPEGGSGET